MKKFFKPFFLFSFCILILPSFSHAYEKWPDTGQTTSYTDTFGEDSDYSINPQSYTKLDASGKILPDDAKNRAMIKDNVTGLVWEAKQNKDGTPDFNYPSDADNTYTWCDTNPATNGGNAGTCGDGTDTTDFIAALNSTNYGGHSDWRLPTIQELSTIVNSDTYNPTISTTFFWGTVSDYYWSSTTNAVASDDTWCVKFNDGTIREKSKSNQYSVRAVRTAQPVASASFVDNNDGTVTDSSTGLMWQKISQTGLKSWESAIADCESLSLAGHDDWRLPSRNELQSLVDYSTYAPAIDTSFFPSQDAWLTYYWSSTTNAAISGNAWFVFFGTGGVPYNDKIVARYSVRAVRSVQPKPDPDPGPEPGSFSLSFISILLLK